MIVITGTQRSGTSVLAQMLDVDATWWDEEVEGGMEDETICAFYRDYLGDATFPFTGRTWPEAETLPGDFVRLDQPVVKFSYLLMNPAFICIWHKFRGDEDLLLVCVREPRQVVKSKAAHDQFLQDSYLLQQDAATLGGNFTASLRVAGLLGFEMRFLSYPFFLQNRQWVNYTLESLGHGGIPSKVWDHYVDLTKVHRYEEAR